VLTRRIAYRVAQGTAMPQHVLALTFTRDAAAS
jgi:superfamily I DNA/RNA helicase